MVLQDSFLFLNILSFHFIFVIGGLIQRYLMLPGVLKFLVSIRATFYILFYFYFICKKMLLEHIEREYHDNIMATFKNAR